MPADFSEYINLEVFDKEPGDIYRDSIELARLTLPEFNLRIGTPEDAIFQAMAYVSALNVIAINRLPNRLMAGLVSMLGFQRQEAIPAEVDVEITVSSYDGGTIPAGTVFSYETLFEDEVQEFAFQTVETITIPPTDLEVSTEFPSEIVTVTCITPGIISPIGDGVEMNIVSSGTEIFSVITTTPSNFSNGINEDIDEDYLSKAVTYLRSLTSAIATPSQLESYVLSNYPSVVTRAKAYDLTNGDDTSGNITVYRTAGVVNTFLQDNLATIETEAPHLFVVGDVMDLEILGNAASAVFNGTHEVLSTGETTISFAKVAGNSGSTSVTGSVYSGEEEEPGYFALFVYGLNDFVSSAQKLEMITDIRDKSVAGLTFEILDPTLLALEITGQVTISSQYEQISTQETIENAILDYLSPLSFPYSEDRVRVSQLLSIISSVPGVVYVQSLSISPSGNGWLPQESYSGSFSSDLRFLNKGSLPLIGLDNISFTYNVSTLV